MKKAKGIGPYVQINMNSEKASFLNEKTWRYISKRPGKVFIFMPFFLQKRYAAIKPRSTIIVDAANKRILMVRTKLHMRVPRKEVRRHWG